MSGQQLEKTYAMPSTPKPTQRPEKTYTYTSTKT